ncbi:MAG: type II toxin-antitoxin system prevent-host-death family antitoxin [Thermoanaerobaculia bacterium]|nr:type II toxin-antitoxin system prevent-host-death family antitoxin [Thermoanaerobaculia bacterium]
MKSVTTREAQHHLAKVLRTVARGEEVAITRRGKPVAKISPLGWADPASRTVDWRQVLGEIRGELSDLPHFQDNTVELLRDGERY